MSVPMMICANNLDPNQTVSNCIRTGSKLFDTKIFSKYLPNLMTFKSISYKSNSRPVSIIDIQKEGGFAPYFEKRWISKIKLPWQTFSIEVPEKKQHNSYLLGVWQYAFNVPRYTMIQTVYTMVYIAVYWTCEAHILSPFEGFYFVVK